MRRTLFVLLMLFILSFGVTSAKPPDLIGSDQCIACHDDEEDLWQKNPHSATSAGCEACHGGGSLHQETIDKKNILNPAEVSLEALVKICGRCHSEKQEQSFSLWEESVHAQAEFTCLNCHNPHEIDNSKLLLEKTVKETCYACHDAKEETFEETAHASEGIECADCHAPHGSTEDYLLKIKKDGKSGCQVCHATKEPHHFIAAKLTLEMRDLKCRDCHQIHSEETEFLKFEKEDLCVNCHEDFY